MKGQQECPVSFKWDYSLERTLDKASVLTDLKLEEKLHYSPNSSELKGALSAQRYDYQVAFTFGKRGDAEQVAGAGHGTLVHILDGTLQTVVFSMRATGANGPSGSKYEVSYFFVYGDGMRVEVKMESLRIGSGALEVTHSINREALPAGEFAAYLKKFGVPENLPESRLQY